MHVGLGFEDFLMLPLHLLQILCILFSTMSEHGDSCFDAF